jgi:hypothetical protein
MNIGNPLILSDTVLVREDSTAAFNAARLQAPNREALMVSEARFYVGYPAGVNRNSYANLGFEAKINLSVGSYVMADKAPIWGLEPSRDALMENGAWYLSCYRWRFLRPIFLPPGIGFTASITRSLVPGILSSYTTVGVPISCTFVARTVTGNFPRSMVVPYALAWAPTPVMQVITADRFAGAALMNLLDKPIELKYGIGRIARVAAIGGGVAPGPMAVCDDIQGAVSVLATGFSALCQFQFGNEAVASTGTEFNSIFDNDRRFLPLADVVLDPGQRPLFRMSAPTGNVGGGFLFAPSVTLIGYRKEIAP